MENVQIVAYKESFFRVPSDIREEQLTNKQVEVGINPLLRYKDNTDAIGCQLRVVYSLDEKIIMEYGAVVTVVIKGWNNILKENITDNELIAASKEAWIQVIGFVRGAICANATKGDNPTISKVLLPVINIDKFMDNIAVEKVV